ncbi:MAG: DUF4321 domain-containing protein [Sedimentibacter sp.]
MRKGGNSIYLVLLLLSSVIIGTILGKALSGYFPILNYGESIGFGPATLDLSIFSVTFGFNANLTVAGIVGILIAIVAYKKL